MYTKALGTRLLRLLLLIALAIPLLGIGGLEALFAPKKDPWPRWQAHDPASRIKIEHDAWENLLQRYVKTDREGVNRVDYVGLNETGRDDLEAYVAYLAAQPVSKLAREEQLA